MCTGRGTLAVADGWGPRGLDSLLYRRHGARIAVSSEAQGAPGHPRLCQAAPEPPWKLRFYPCRDASLRLSLDRYAHASFCLRWQAGQAGPRAEASRCGPRRACHSFTAGPRLYSRLTCRQLFQLEKECYCGEEHVEYAVFQDPTHVAAVASRNQLAHLRPDHVPCSLCPGTYAN